MGINTNEAHWNGKPDWLEELVEIFCDYDEYRDAPDIISGHNQAPNDADLEFGSVGIDNTDSGQHSIIRKLRQHGFVITEIHENQFYIGKLESDVSFGETR